MAGFRVGGEIVWLQKMITNGKSSSIKDKRSSYVKFKDKQ